MTFFLFIRDEWSIWKFLSAPGTVRNETVPSVNHPAWVFAPKHRETDLSFSTFFGFFKGNKHPSTTVLRKAVLSPHHWFWDNSMDPCFAFRTIA